MTEDPHSAHQLPWPDRDQIGALTALVLLAYGLIRIVVLPTWHVEFNLLGLLIRFDFNARTVMVALSGALAAIGSEWVMQSHPLSPSGRQATNRSAPPVSPSRSSPLQSPGARSRVLPGLAALGAGAVLPLLPLGPVWVIGLMAAGGLVFAVLLAEYVALDRDDPRYPAAAAGLRSLGILIVVGVSYAARANSIRAIFAVPAVFAAVSLVSWRSLELEVPRSPAWLYAVACGLLAAQLAWGLHYWPVSPLQMALLVGLVSYLACGLGIANLRGNLRPAVLYEFAVLAVVTLAAVLLVA